MKKKVRILLSFRVYRNLIFSRNPTKINKILILIANMEAEIIIICNTMITNSLTVAFNLL